MLLWNNHSRKIHGWMLSTRICQQHSAGKCKHLLLLVGRDKNERFSEINYWTESLILAKFFIFTQCYRDKTYGVLFNLFNICYKINHVTPVVQMEKGKWQPGWQNSGFGDWIRNFDQLWEMSGQTKLQTHPSMLLHFALHDLFLLCTEARNLSL